MKKLLIGILILFSGINTFSQVVNSDSLLKRNSFTVSVLMPFQASKISVNASSRNNQFVLDYYEGLRMAKDSLLKRNLNFKLQAIDIEKDTNKLFTILNDDEFKKSHLIIGPVYSQLSQYICVFSEQTGIPSIIPFTNANDWVLKTEKTILQEPAYATIAEKSLDYYFNNFSIDTCIIISSKQAKDTILANQFAKYFTKRLGVVLDKKKLDRSSSWSLSKALSPENMKKAGLIIVFHNDAMVRANIMSMIEAANFQNPIFTNSEWLNEQMGSYEQLEKRKIHFITNDFIDRSQIKVEKFRSKYIQEKGFEPSSFAYKGYEMLLLMGKLFEENRFNPLETLKKDQNFEAIIQNSYRYYDKKDNQKVTILKFDSGKLIQANTLE